MRATEANRLRSWEYRQMLKNILDATTGDQRTIKFECPFSASATSAVEFLKDLGYEVSWSVPKNKSLMVITVAW